jgi:hypothetical protein
MRYSPPTDNLSLYLISVYSNTSSCSTEALFDDYAAVTGECAGGMKVLIEGKYAA